MGYRIPTARVLSGVESRLLCLEVVAVDNCGTIEGK